MIKNLTTPIVGYQNVCINAIIKYIADEIAGISRIDLSIICVLTSINTVISNNANIIPV